MKFLLRKEDIERKVEELAKEIKREYEGKNPILIGVLKGSFIFLSDLIRRLDFPLEVDFVEVSSYGMGKESSGKIRVRKGIRSDIKNRHVLIVEDIVDTGLTTKYLIESLKKKKPASIKLCSLLSKPSRRKVHVDIDFLGFEIPDKFVVGYGLDFAEKYRNLPYITEVEE